MYKPHFLEPFLNPESIAIIGLSRKAATSPINILTTLKDYGFKGEIVVVNPKLPPQDGLSIHPDIESIDREIELALVSVPRTAVPGVLRECAANGILNVVVITQGFADADEQGHKLQDELLTIKQQTGMRILGPNTLGVANGFGPFTSSFFEVRADRAPVGLIAQSGLFLMGFNNINDVSAGYGMAIDLGNGCDVSLVDVLEYYEQHDNIDVIQCHLESVEDGRAFMETAARVSEKKPIIALKSGTSEAGQLAAASHSGAAAGENQMYSAAFEKAGIVQAENAEDMRLLSKAFSTYQAPAGKNVAVFTFSGGAGVLSIDAIESAGLNLASLAPATLKKIQNYFPDWMEITNPLDIWYAVSGDDFHDLYPKLLEWVLEDENVDAVICVYASLTMPKYKDYNVSLHLRSLARKYPHKPIMGWTYGLNVSGLTRDIEQDGDVIVFPTLESASRSLRAMYDHRCYRLARQNEPSPVIREVDSARVQSLLAKASEAGKTYLFTEAFEVLEAYGFNTAPWGVAKNRSDLSDLKQTIDFPVAMKMISPDLVHKSDAGGVKLGVNSLEEAEAAYDHMMALADNKQARVEGVFVQAMAASGQEVLLGAKNDPIFGPGLIVGAGGVYTEILEDFSFAIAPIHDSEAENMVNRLKFSAILKGARGQAACDLEAIRDMLMRLSQLISDFPEIAELDINPVFVNENGVVAVDARILLDGGP